MSTYTPIDLGLPEKFSAWRRGQPDMLERALDWALSGTRSLALCMPTGSGKSLIYMALANAVGRTAILTSTKGLQNQLLEDFHSMGLVDIRGMGNYECLLDKEPGTIIPCDEGRCMGGYKCDLNLEGCQYFDAKKIATASQLVVTNYSYWLRIQNPTEENAKTLGKFDLLILDEAHNAPDELAGYLSVELGATELEELLGEELPDETADWSEWCREPLKKCVTILAHKNGDHSRERARYIKSVRSLAERLAKIVYCKGDWVSEPYRDARGSRKVKFDPVNVEEYRYELFGAIPKVLFVSATVRPKTLYLLGQQDHQFEESQISFPVGRRPVTYIPTVKMHHGMGFDQMKWWVNRIDQIIDKRTDRKGIVHTTSYKRAKFLAEHSRHSDKMMLPEGWNTRQVVERFKQMPEGGVLVSPALTTGYDFPGPECRYQIIGKIPFPDTRSVVLKAREELDKDYGPYQAMQTIVQSSGRGMRSEEDWCETVIVDDQWKWFYPRYKQFAPDWFKRAVRISSMVPDPIYFEK